MHFAQIFYISLILKRSTVLRLIEEIKKVTWLPQDNSRTYTLLDFQTALLEKNQAAQVSLGSFLHCHAAILNMVKCEELYYQCFYYLC